MWQATGDMRHMAHDMPLSAHVETFSVSGMQDFLLLLFYLFYLVMFQTSEWQRIKMGFKWREWEGRIEIDQVEGKEKTHKLEQV